MRLGLVLSSLRVLGLALRLLLSLFVVRVMGVDVFGYFSLLLAVAMMAPSVVSMGLHYHANRAAVGQSPEIMASGLRDRIALNILIGVVIAMMALATHLFLHPVAISTTSLAIFLLICILESVLTDAQLYLMSCQLPVLASLMLFSRASLWVPPFMVAAWLLGWKSLDPILLFWLCGNLLAVGIIWVGLQHWPWHLVLRRKPSFLWQFSNFHTAFGIWLSDVSAAIIPLMERSLLLVILGATQTGIYAFFWTLANGIQQVVVTAVIQPNIPVMVDSVHRDASGKLLFAFVWRKSYEAVAAVTGFGSIVVFISYFALPFLDRPELLGSFIILPLLIAGIAVGCISETLRLALYSLRRDGDLILSNVGALVLNVALLAASAAAFGLVAVALVPLLVATSISIFRWRRAQRGVQGLSKTDGETGT